MAEGLNPEQPKNPLDNSDYQEFLIPLLSEENVEILMEEESRRISTNSRDALFGTRLNQLGTALFFAKSDKYLTEDEWRDMDARMRETTSVPELVALASELKSKIERQS